MKRFLARLISVSIIFTTSTPGWSQEENGRHVYVTGDPHYFVAQAKPGENRIQLLTNQVADMNKGLKVDPMRFNERIAEAAYLQMGNAAQSKQIETVQIRKPQGAGRQIINVAAARTTAMGAGAAAKTAGSPGGAGSPAAGVSSGSGSGGSSTGLAVTSGLLAAFLLWKPITDQVKKFLNRKKKTKPGEKGRFKFANKDEELCKAPNEYQPKDRAPEQVANKEGIVYKPCSEVNSAYGHSCVSKLNHSGDKKEPWDCVDTSEANTEKVVSLARANGIDCTNKTCILKYDEDGHTPASLEVMSRGAGGGKATYQIDGNTFNLDTVERGGVTYKSLQTHPELLNQLMENDKTFNSTHIVEALKDKYALDKKTLMIATTGDRATPNMFVMNQEGISLKQAVYSGTSVNLPQAPGVRLDNQYVYENPQDAEKYILVQNKRTLSVEKSVDDGTGLDTFRFNLQDGQYLRMTDSRTGLPTEYRGLGNGTVERVTYDLKNKEFARQVLDPLGREIPVSAQTIDKHAVGFDPVNQTPTTLDGKPLLNAGGNRYAQATGIDTAVEVPKGVQNFSLKGFKYLSATPNGQYAVKELAYRVSVVSGREGGQSVIVNYVLEAYNPQTSESFGTATYDASTGQRLNGSNLPSQIAPPEIPELDTEEAKPQNTGGQGLNNSQNNPQNTANKTQTGTALIKSITANGFTETRTALDQSYGGWAKAGSSVGKNYVEYLTIKNGKLVSSIRRYYKDGKWLNQEDAVPCNSLLNCNEAWATKS